MMKSIDCKENLLIIGAGMYGYVVKEVAESLNKYNEISFVDDFCKRDDVVATTEMIPELRKKYRYGIVAIGNPELRKKASLLLKDSGYEIPTLIHPKAYVSQSANLGVGCVIEPMAVVHSNSTLGTGCLVCAGSVVNHNALIEDFCQIDCNAVVGADAYVPCGTKVMYGEVIFKK